jgi:hypothetical protein
MKNFRMLNLVVCKVAARLEGYIIEFHSIKVKWSEVSYGEVLGDKSAMFIRVTLYWGYLITLWLFHLGISCTVFNLYCGCCNLFCNVCVCVCVCVLVICVLVFTVFCIVCTVFFVLFRLCFVCNSVRTIDTEWKLNGSYNNNNNNNNNNNKEHSVHLQSEYDTADGLLHSGDWFIRHSGSRNMLPTLRLANGCLRVSVLKVLTGKMKWSVHLETGV